MTKKAIAEVFKYHLAKYGSGYTYDFYINGGPVMNRKQAMKSVKEGDTVRVTILTGHRSYWGPHDYGYESFTVKPLELGEESPFQRFARQNPYKRVRDYQRQKVYNWEASVLPYGISDRMSPEGIAELLREVWNDYSLKGSPPKVEISNRKKRFSTAHGDYLIKLAAGWGQSKRVVLHELAHIICNRYGKCDQHGPNFVAQALELYMTYLDEVPDNLIDAADEAGIDYNSSFSLED